MNTMTIPTYQDTLDRRVMWSIENNLIHRDLHRACRAAGADYSEVVEHIASEVAANEEAGR